MKPSEFYDDLLPRLPGATEPLVLHELCAALRQLCEEGWAWPIDFGPLNVKASKSRVYLDPMPDDTRVGYVLWARYEPASGSRTLLSPLTRFPFTSEPEGTPRYFYMDNTGELLLHPTPLNEELNSLLVACTLIPTCDTCELPDYFYTHYRDAIIAGVCSRMMRMASKPWADRANALMFGREFRNHIKRTRDITKTRYSFSDAPWRFPHFAAQMV